MVDPSLPFSLPHRQNWKQLDCKIMCFIVTEMASPPQRHRKTLNREWVIESLQFALSVYIAAHGESDRHSKKRQLWIEISESLASNRVEKRSFPFEMASLAEIVDDKKWENEQCLIERCSRNPREWISGRKEWEDSGSKMNEKSKTSRSEKWKPQ
jgi:hypothetical protein